MWLATTEIQLKSKTKNKTKDELLIYFEIQRHLDIQAEDQGTHTRMKVCKLFTGHLIEVFSLFHTASKKKTLLSEKKWKFCRWWRPVYPVHYILRTKSVVSLNQDDLRVQHCTTIYFLNRKQTNEPSESWSLGHYHRPVTKLQLRFTSSGNIKGPPPCVHRCIIFHLQPCFTFRLYRLLRVTYP